MARHPAQRMAGLRLGLAVALALTLAGCASGGGAGGAEADRTSYNVLTAEDLQQTTESTVWDAIRRLRPQWLRTRGRTSLTGQSPDEPTVYVGRARYGGLRDLQQMQVSQVTSIRFIEPIEHLPTGATQAPAGTGGLNSRQHAPS